LPITMPIIRSLSRTAAHGNSSTQRLSLTVTRPGETGKVVGSNPIGSTISQLRCSCSSPLQGRGFPPRRRHRVVTTKKLHHFCSEDFPYTISFQGDAVVFSPVRPLWPESIMIRFVQIAQLKGFNAYASSRERVTFPPFFHPFSTGQLP